MTSSPEDIHGKLRTFPDLLEEPWVAHRANNNKRRLAQKRKLYVFVKMTLHFTWRWNATALLFVFRLPIHGSLRPTVVVVHPFHISECPIVSPSKLLSINCAMNCAKKCAPPPLRVISRYVPPRSAKYIVGGKLLSINCAMMNCAMNCAINCSSAAVTRCLPRSLQNNIVVVGG